MFVGIRRDASYDLLAFTVIWFVLMGKQTCLVVMHKIWIKKVSPLKNATVVDDTAIYLMHVGLDPKMALYYYERVCKGMGLKISKKM